MKITAKNGSDFRPKDGEFSTTTLVELVPNASSKRIPANILFLVDASSSMGGDKWSMVRTAMNELVGSLKDDDRVSLVLFGTNAREVFPLASLAENRGAMQDAIRKLENPSGVTNLEAGLKMAYKAFEARDQADRVKRVNHVILLTDGFPTDNQGYRLEKFDKFEKIVAEHEHITLTGVGIGSADDYDSDFISRLSELGRGSYYHANAMDKFKEGLQAEMQKLQSSVVGDLTLKFTNVSARVMRIARVAPEIVIYDIPGNAKNFELPTGSMTKDLTSFLVQTSSQGNGQDEIPLFSVEATYDGANTEKVDVKVKTTEREADLGQVDQDVFRASQVLQVHLNGQQIQASLESGDKDKATRLIQNTTRIASNLGQDKVTRALTRLANDVRAGKSVANELATIKDEAKKTKLLIS
ncbi:VWA domain-containing protein [bacterium]|nr:VWA domain-containing protein [bacterium]